MLYVDVWRHTISVWFAFSMSDFGATHKILLRATKILGLDTCWTHTQERCASAVSLNKVFHRFNIQINASVSDYSSYLIPAQECSRVLTDAVESTTTASTSSQPSLWNMASLTPNSTPLHTVTVTRGEPRTAPANIWHRPGVRTLWPPGKRL